MVNHSVGAAFGGWRYALLPLGEDGPVWRTIRAAGTEAQELSSLVYYTDDRIRVEFQLKNSYINGPSSDLVVEAPRRGSSAIRVTWPKGITLPLLDAKSSSPPAP